MSSKYIDVSAIVQVIGCVYNNPNILGETDKYIITEDDFVEDFHKIVFGTMYKLYELGASKFSIESIIDFLSDRPKKKAIFDLNHGTEYIQKVSSFASEETFNYYYNRMKKMSLLRAYDKIGLDVSFIYDPDNILDSKKKQIQEEQLDNSSLVELVNKIDLRIDKIKENFIGNEYGQVAQAGQGLRQLISRYKENPEVGVPLYGSLINTVTRGARLKKFYLRSAPTGAGKAIPNNTLIPTPIGWRQVGDIKEGDYLFGQDGKPTKVLKIYPQSEKKEVWEITFADGRKAKCCGEHLWEYRYRSHRGFAYRVENTQTIYNRTLKLKNGFKDDSNKGYRFHIRLNEGVEYPEKEFSLPPYVMGAFLGDGCFRYYNSNKSLRFSSENKDIPSLITFDLNKQDKFNHNWEYQKNSDYNYSWTFRKKDNPTHPIWVEEFLKNYPELWNVKSEDKFIPQDYLQGSYTQRIKLLEGLLDTDGSIDKKGRVSFATVSPKLRDNIIELCRSLGFVATYSVDNRSNKYTTKKCYEIYIQCKKEDKPLLFRLPRKHDIAVAYAKSNKREEYKDHLAIINIKRLEEKTDMTCFTVDNENHLFLTNDFIVTHNTRTMIADCCQIGCNMIYDENFGWIKNGISEPSLFITTEQEIEEVQTMMVAFLSNVNEEHILNGKYENDEEERVQKAIEIIENSNIYIEELPDFSLEDVENVIKKEIREHDVKYVFYDYLHSSLKILEEISKKTNGMKLREDNILFMLSIKLKDICNQYGIFLMSSTQLNGNYTESKTPDQNLLRGAKAIADKVDVGMILLPVSDEDKKGLEQILASNIFEEPNLKLAIYKNRRGRFKGTILWCKAELGTCRVKPMFMTNYNYELISINDMKIMVKEESAF